MSNKYLRDVELSPVGLVLLSLFLAIQVFTTNAQQPSDRDKYSQLFAKEWKLSKVLVDNDSNRLVEVMDENQELGLALRRLGLSAAGMDSLLLQMINANVRFQADFIHVTVGPEHERSTFDMRWRQKGSKMKVYVPDEKPHWLTVSHLSSDEMILTITLRVQGRRRNFEVTLIFRPVSP